MVDKVIADHAEAVYNAIAPLLGTTPEGDGLGHDLMHTIHDVSAAKRELDMCARALRACGSEVGFSAAWVVEERIAALLDYAARVTGLKDWSIPLR
jgi:hypothetical protein